MAHKCFAKLLTYSNSATYGWVNEKVRQPIFRVTLDDAPADRQQHQILALAIGVLGAQVDAHRSDLDVYLLPVLVVLDGAKLSELNAQR